MANNSGAFSANSGDFIGSASDGKEWYSSGV